MEYLLFVCAGFFCESIIKVAGSTLQPLHTYQVQVHFICFSHYGCPGTTCLCDVTCCHLIVQELLYNSLFQLQIVL